MGMKTNIFRNGKVHVCAKMCSTCIFRPGNLMSLEPGRVEQMIAQATKDESTIVCHQTLDQRDKLACRGFFDKHPTQTLQIAQRLQMVEYVKVKKS